MEDDDWVFHKDNSGKSDNSSEHITQHGFEEKKPYTAKDISEFIGKHANVATKTVWKAIEKTAEALGVKVNFINDAEYFKIHPKNSNGAYKNGEITIRSGIFGNPARAAYVMTHEAVHGVTSHIINTVKKGDKTALANLSEKQIKAAQTLSKLLEYSKAKGHLKGEYGITNEHELLAELSNPDFVKKLQGANKGVVDRIVNWVMDMIGIPQTDYDKARKILKDMLTAPKQVESNNKGVSLKETTITKQQKDLGVQYSMLTKSDFNADGTVKESVLAEIEAEKKTVIEQAKANGTYMQAPNGKATNLNEEQWVAVRTERFKAWFGDWDNDPENSSKVVDENGEPLVVYHGTDVWFNEFAKDKIWSNTVKPTYTAPDGFYFAKDKALADRYGKNIVPIFIGKGDVLLNNSKIVVVENPSQIKSATDNAGTFSSNNNNILFQKDNNAPNNRKTFTKEEFNAFTKAWTKAMGISGKVVTDAKTLTKVLGKDSADFMAKVNKLQKQYNFLFKGKAVANLTGKEFSQQAGKPLRTQVLDFFNSFGNKVKSVFGEVLLDQKAIITDLEHGNYREKAAAFKAIPEILKNGIEIKEWGQHHKGETTESGMIAAPIVVDGKEYIGVVTVRGSKNRMYVHDVYLKEKVLADSRNSGNSNPTTATSANTDSSNQGKSSPAIGKDAAKVLKDIVTSKNNPLQLMARAEDSRIQLLWDIDFLRTADGTIFGATYINPETRQREYYINPEHLNAETLIHETYHPFDSMMSEAAISGDAHAKAAITALDKLAKEQGYLERVQNNKSYAGKTLAEQQAEARTQMVGEVGNAQLEKSFYNKLKTAVSDAIQWIANKFGVSLKGYTPEQVLNLKLNDLVKASLGSMRKGEFDGKDSGGIRKQIIGEVEARNAQKRLTMTEQERKEQMLSETEDVAEGSKIYLYGDNGKNGNFIEQNTADGISYLSEHGGDYGHGPIADTNDLQWGGSADNSKYLSVRAVWNKIKHLSFTGGAKIKSHADVAHIMRLLENKSVEHSFAVHVDKNGNPHIQFLGIGGVAGTLIDVRTILNGVKKKHIRKSVFSAQPPNRQYDTL